MSNDLVLAQASKLEQVLIQGDLSSLSPGEKVSYYNKVCQNLGLDSLTKPFEYIKLNGKLVLYARKDCADQLRKIHSVSIEIVDAKEINGVWCVTALAKLPNGRTDSSMGAVTIKGLQADALANALMKAETKAKRRATLSICGLGMLDETELETIPSTAHKSTSDVNKMLAPGSDAKEPQGKPKSTPSQKPAPAISRKPPEHFASMAKEMGIPMRDPSTPAPEKQKPVSQNLEDPGIYQIPDGWGRHAGKRLKEISKLEAEAYIGMLEQKAQRDELDQTGKQILFWFNQYARGKSRETPISKE